MDTGAELNIVLKEMWRLDEKLSAGEQLSTEEDQFFADNLQVISDYYKKNCRYWREKKKAHENLI
jgi:hypothetical protein